MSSIIDIPFIQFSLSKINIFLLQSPCDNIYNIERWSIQFIRNLFCQGGNSNNVIHPLRFWSNMIFVLWCVIFTHVIKRKETKLWSLDFFREIQHFQCVWVSTCKDVEKERYRGCEGNPRCCLRAWYVSRIKLLCILPKGAHGSLSIYIYIPVSAISHHKKIPIFLTFFNFKKSQKRCICFLQVDTSKENFILLQMGIFLNWN